MSGRLMVVVMAALWVAACDPGPPLPRVDRFGVRRLNKRQTARPWPVTLTGRRFTTSARHPLRFELLRLKPSRPRVTVALERLRPDGDRLKAQVPAGIGPGTYGLVAYRGSRGRLTRHRVRVRAPVHNVGYPVLTRVRARHNRAGEAGRVVITGANLLQTALITLHGPQRRGARKAVKGEARMVGRKVQIPFKPLYRRLRIRELRHPYQAAPNRVVAKLPRWLAPGRYYVQVYTATHRGNKPDVTFMVGKPLGTGHRIWGAAVAGLLLLLALLGVILLGRPWKGRRRRLVLLLGVLLSGAAPLLLLM